MGLQLCYLATIANY